MGLPGIYHAVKLDDLIVVQGLKFNVYVLCPSAILTTLSMWPEEGLQKTTQQYLRTSLKTSQISGHISAQGRRFGRSLTETWTLSFVALAREAP